MRKVNDIINSKLIKVLFMYSSSFYEKGILFIVTFLLARSYGTEQFGIYSYYMAVGGIVFVLFDLGGDFYLSKVLVQNKEKFEYIVRNITIAKTMVFLIILLVSIIANCLSENINFLIVLVLVAFFTDSINSIYKSINYVNHYYEYESMINIIEKTILIILSFIVIFFKMHILYIFLVMIISRLISLILRMKKIKKSKIVSSRGVNISGIKEVLLNSAIFVIHALLVVIFFQIDIIMIERMLSAEAVGIYSAAVKIILGAMVIPEVLFKFFYPKLSLDIKESNKRFSETFNKYLFLELVLALPIFLIIFIFNKEIINIIYNSAYAESQIVLRILSYMIMLRFAMYPFTAILSAGDKQGLKAITSAMCTIVNIGMNFVLIPKMGMAGAAVATIITEFVLLLLYYIFSKKLVDRIEKKNYIVMLIYSVLIFSCFMIKKFN